MTPKPNDPRDLFHGRSEDTGHADKGVRRLNKKPLAIALVIILLVGGTLLLAGIGRNEGGLLAWLFKKDKDTRVSTQMDPGTADILKANPLSGLIRMEKPIPPEPDVIQPAPLSEKEYEVKAKVEDPAMDELRRILAEKQHLFEQAVESSTALNFASSKSTTAAKTDGDLADRNINVKNPLNNYSRPAAQPPSGDNKDINMQDEKIAFFEKSKITEYLPHLKQQPLSPYDLKTGTVIPGILITGINSDLPGNIIAQVSQNVYDTATGGSLLIPQGSRLFGMYQSQVSYGQKRVMVAWNRIIFPDASTLELINMPGSDEGGYSGFEDMVDNHYMRIFGSAIMMSIITSGVQLSQPESKGGGYSAQEIASANLGQRMGQVSEHMILKNLNIQPTIVIRPGYRLNVIINKDIKLEPWQG